MNRTWQIIRIWWNYKYSDKPDQNLLIRTIYWWFWVRIDWFIHQPKHILADQQFVVNCPHRHGILIISYTSKFCKFFLTQPFLSIFNVLCGNILWFYTRFGKFTQSLLARLQIIPRLTEVSIESIPLPIRVNCNHVCSQLYYIKCITHKNSIDDIKRSLINYLLIQIWSLYFPLFIYLSFNLIFFHIVYPIS